MNGGASGLDEAGKQFNVSRETIEKLRIYQELLVKWNPKINLVSKSTIADAVQRHFVDSMQIWQYRQEFQTWVDVGSGAGFPGMVLAIMAQGGDFHFVESDARKCAFLRNVSRETETPVQIHTDRIENITNLQADIVSARALASLDKLLEHSENLTAHNAICLYLKGQNCESEIAEASRNWTFEAEKFKSQTDVNGTILRIRNFQRVQRAG